MLRFASESDAETLLGIYAQYIDTTITFEYDLPSVETFRERIRSIRQDYPYLVWEENGTILGYAYAHHFAERAAYQWSAELSVYLNRSARGRGLGAVLYTALMKLTALQGVHTVYALVTSHNERSDRFHADMGFHIAGTVENAGFKNGRWLGVTYYEKAIRTYDDAPSPLLPVRALEPSAVADILGQ